VGVFDALVADLRRVLRLADNRYDDDLLGRYSLVRQFLPTLLKTLTFGGTPAGRPVLAAWAFLRRIEGQKVPDLGAQLDAAYRRTAANLPTNTAVRVERVAGRDTPVLTPLDKPPEPPSLVTLRELVATRLPRVDLPEVLLEVQGWTGFAAEFAHLSEGNARVADLTTSLCAALLADACNVGLEPLVCRDVPALTRGRLGWVQQNYIPRRDARPRQRPAGRCAGGDPAGAGLGRRGGGLGRRAALRGAGADGQRWPQPHTLGHMRRYTCLAIKA